MEHREFDQFVRESADAPTRRTLVRGLAAALGVSGLGLMLTDGVDAGKSKKKKKQQQKKKEKQKEKKQECNDKKSCAASTNPCKVVACESNKCVTSNASDGTACGTGLACSAGQCVAAVCSSDATCGPNGCSCTQPNRQEVPGTGLCQQSTFSQSFANNAVGWFAMLNQDNTWYPPATDDTIVLENGHAVLKAANAYTATEKTAMSPLGGRTEVFPAGGWDVSLDIYLDLEDLKAFERFAYSAAANRTDCTHYQDFIFDVGVNTAGDAVCVAKSTGANGNPTDVCTRTDKVDITDRDSGWFRFVHKFRQDGTDLKVQMIVTDLGDGNAPVFDQSLTGTLGEIDEVGGSRYAFFPFNNYPEGVMIRNSERVNHD